MNLYSIIYIPKLDKLLALDGMKQYLNTDTRRILGVIEAVTPEMALYRWLNFLD